MIEVKNDTLKIVREGEVVQIEAYGRDIIRVKSGSFRNLWYIMDAIGA